MKCSLTTKKLNELNLEYDVKIKISIIKNKIIPNIVVVHTKIPITFTHREVLIIKYVLWFFVANNFFWGVEHKSIDIEIFTRVKSFQLFVQSFSRIYINWFRNRFHLSLIDRKFIIVKTKL